MRYLIVVGILIGSLMAVRGDEAVRLYHDGNRLYSEHRYEEALIAYARALVLDNQDEDNFNNVTRTLIKLGKYQAAIENIFLSANRIERIADMQVMYHNLALAYEKQGEVSLAAGYYFYSGELFSDKSDLLKRLRSNLESQTDKVDPEFHLKPEYIFSGGSGTHCSVFFNKLKFLADEVRSEQVDEAFPDVEAKGQPTLLFALVDHHLFYFEFPVWKGCCEIAPFLMDINQDGHVDLVVEMKYHDRSDWGLCLWRPELGVFSSGPWKSNKIVYIDKKTRYIVRRSYVSGDGDRVTLSFEKLGIAQADTDYIFKIRSQGGGKSEVVFYRYDDVSQDLGAKLFEGILKFDLGSTRFDVLFKLIEEVQDASTRLPGR